MKPYKYIPKLPVSKDSHPAEVWAYGSRSGKTLDIYVRPMNGEYPVLRTPVIVRLNIAKLATEKQP